MGGEGSWDYARFFVLFVGLLVSPFELFHPPFREKGKVLCRTSFFHYYGVFALRGIISRGEGEEVWSLVRFSALLWASISRDFCSYSLGLVLLDLSIFWFGQANLGSLLVCCFCMPAFLFSLFARLWALLNSSIFFNESLISFDKFFFIQMRCLNLRNPILEKEEKFKQHFQAILE